MNGLAFNPIHSWRMRRQHVSAVDVTGGNYYAPYEIASFTRWELRARAAVDDLVAALQRRYQVTPERWRPEVMPFGKPARENRLLELVDAD